MGRRARLLSAPVGTSNELAQELAAKAQRGREDARRLAESPHVQDLTTAVQTLHRADSLLGLAQAADSKWSRLWIDRGWVAYDLAHLLRGDTRSAEAKKGLQYAEHAVRLAPSNPEALALRGTLGWQLVSQAQSLSDDPQGLSKVENDLRAALDRDSTLVRGWTILSDLLWFKGSTAEAALAARRALQEDTYLADALDIYHQLFFDDLMLGEFRSAAEWCKRGRLTFPRHWRFVECELTLMRHDTESKPDPERAWALVKELERIDPPEKAKAQGREYHSIYRRVVAATISARAGQRGIARAEIARARRAVQADTILSMDLNYDEAYLRFLLGERARAARLLREYIEARPMARDYLARDPLFRNLSFASLSFMGPGTP
jgi:hypothetical protein